MTCAAAAAARAAAGARLHSKAVAYFTDAAGGERQNATPVSLSRVNWMDHAPLALPPAPRRRPGRRGWQRRLAPAVALACLAGTARADWIVTREGHEIETRGAWRVEGSRVLFTSLGGTLQAISVAEVDLAWSEELSQERRDRWWRHVVYPAPVSRRLEPAPPEPERAASPPGGTRLERDEVAIATPSEPDVYLPVRRREGAADRLAASIRVGATSHDNLFEDDDDEAPTAMTTGQAEALLRWRLLREARHLAYLQATRTELEDLPATNGLRLGVRLDNRRHALDFSSRLLRGYKYQDLGDDGPEPVERRIFAGAYETRPVDNWSVEVAGELEEERLDTPERNADVFGFAAAVTYRGFDRITPELGVAWSERDAVRASRNYDEPALFFKLRLFPTERLAFELGGRQRERDYTIADAEASNTGRRDTKRDWSLGAHFLVLDDVVLSLLYEVEENDSSRDGQSYEAHRLGMSVGVSLDRDGRGGRDGVREQAMPMEAVPRAGEGEEEEEEEEDDDGGR